MRTDSPFYTAARPIPGQTETPVGTVHMCAQCKSDYVCDLEACRIDRVTFGVDSPCCGGAGPHSSDRRNIMCKHCLEYNCHTKHKVCRHCGGVDGEHFNCRTQPGYQFGLELERAQ